jgi:1-acyl-sn-glycerol-3-phosphate acyltransferase
VGREIRGAEKLSASLAAGHGVVLAPNHVRECDAITVGFLAIKCQCYLNIMASWHVFKGSWFQSFMIRQVGAFSVHREGMDKTSINTAIQILTEAKRPLVLFPEGYCAFHNDILSPLQEGVSLIVQRAARKREEKGGQVVVHPVVIKYQYAGSPEETLEPILAGLEQRLGLDIQTQLSILDRVHKIGAELLGLREMEYFGKAQTGGLFERQERLIEHLLQPLEVQWDRPGEGSSVYERVKALRTVLLRELVEGNPDAETKKQCWRQLSDCMFALRLQSTPADYLKDNHCVERLLETVERFEDDIDNTIPKRPYRVVIEVGDGLPVSPQRDRKGPGIMKNIELSLNEMLRRLAVECNQPLPKQDCDAGSVAVESPEPIRPSAGISA